MLLVSRCDVGLFFADVFVLWPNESWMRTGNHVLAGASVKSLFALLEVAGDGSGPWLCALRRGPAQWFSFGAILSCFYSMFLREVIMEHAFLFQKDLSLGCELSIAAFCSRSMSFMLSIVFGDVQ